MVSVVVVAVVVDVTTIVISLLLLLKLLLLPLLLLKCMFLLSFLREVNFLASVMIFCSSYPSLIFCITVFYCYGCYSC